MSRTPPPRRSRLISPACGTQRLRAQARDGGAEAAYAWFEGSLILGSRTPSGVGLERRHRGVGASHRLVPESSPASVVRPRPPVRPRSWSSGTRACRPPSRISTARSRRLPTLGSPRERIYGRQEVRRDGRPAESARDPRVRARGRRDRRAHPRPARADRARHARGRRPAHQHDRIVPHPTNRRDRPLSSALDRSRPNRSILDFSEEQGGICLEKGGVREHDRSQTHGSSISRRQTPRGCTAGDFIATSLSPREARRASDTLASARIALVSIWVNGIQIVNTVLLAVE